MAFIESIQTISAALKVAREPNDINVEYDKADLKLKIADLASNLASAQLQFIEVQNELQSRDDRIIELEKLVRLKASTIEIYGFEYEVDENGHAVGSPYCPRCWKIDGAPIKLAALRSRARHNYCAECKDVYPESVRRQPPQNEE